MVHHAFLSLIQLKKPWSYYAVWADIHGFVIGGIKMNSIEHILNLIKKRKWMSLLIQNGQGRN